MSNLYKLYSVNVNGANTITGIQSQNIDPSITELIKGSDGEVYVRFSGIQQATPAVDFSTCHITSVLDLTGITGLLCSSSSVFSFQKVLCGGTRDTGNGIKLTAATGFLYPKTISAATNSEATISCGYIGSNSTGLTNPFIIGSGCPAATQTGITSLYTVGPIVIGSTTVTQVSNINIDFGIQVQPHHGDGLPYPDCIYIEQIVPRFTATLENISNISDVGLEGVFDDVVVYLRQKAKNGTVELNASSKHIKLEFKNCYITLSPLSGQHSGLSNFGLKAICEYDGTNAPIIYTKDQAIA